ncbi:hypothetical protein [Amantichitinum ursilacus]|uniref:hypothetical protein n=1 Tax=Amantichitinum ursilacus TaxID=857265 RepID=UPI00128F5950|nr:hypothetical protein [Amantichitinum ursilacus]
MDFANTYPKRCFLLLKDREYEGDDADAGIGERPGTAVMKDGKAVAVGDRMRQLKRAECAHGTTLFPEISEMRLILWALWQRR